MSSSQLKNHQRESRLFNRRCIAMLFFVGLFLVAIITRLVDLQILQYHAYRTQSLNNLLRVMPITPTRGLIYDRNGVLLASNIPVYNLTITADAVSDLDETLNQLKQFIPLTDTEVALFKRHIKLHPRYQPTVLKYHLSEAEMTAYYLNRYRLPGVNVDATMLRTYPLGKSFGHVIGYVGRINSREYEHVNHKNYQPSDYIGKTGIERYYEDTLHGQVGASLVETNASGEIVDKLKETPSTPGQNLYLTIDSKLQQFAEKALGKNNGAVVAIQPSTGEILALVTKPSYDPNPFVMGISQKAYKQLLDDPNHPLYDRAVRGLYSPGSTIKPFHALNGLSSETITPQFTIYDHGWFRVPGTKHIFHDDDPNGHGIVNLHKAIRVSCDTYFYGLATKLGITRIDDFLSKFGFGQLTHIDLPDELPGVLPSPNWKRANRGASWYTGDTVNVGIGQGMLLVTPLQLASATTMIANRGARYQPHLIMKTQQADGSYRPVEPTPLPTIHIKPYYWHTVINAMESVIEHGTARYYGAHPGYKVAGKTGTAQVYGTYRDEDTTDWQRPKQLRNNHLFIDFAPVRHPDITVAVVVEHASFADTIAGKVTRFYLNELKHTHHAPTHT